MRAEIPIIGSDLRHRYLATRLSVLLTKNPLLLPRQKENPRVLNSHD